MKVWKVTSSLLADERCILANTMVECLEWLRADYAKNGFQSLELHVHLVGVVSGPSA